MPEGPPKPHEPQDENVFEQKAEKILTKEEVLAILGKLAESGTIEKEHSDELGLCVLEIKVGNIAYKYMRHARKGERHHNGNVIPVTGIYITAFGDDGSLDLNRTGEVFPSSTMKLASGGN